MVNAIFAALNDGTQNMLLTLLLIALLIIWLQSKFNKEFGGLRKEITDGNAALRKEIADGNAALRKEIADGNATLRKEITDGNATLRKEITDGNAALSKEVSDCKDELRKDIAKVAARVARIEGRLGPPAPVPKTQQSAKAG